MEDLGKVKLSGWSPWPKEAHWCIKMDRKVAAVVETDNKISLPTVTVAASIVVVGMG